MDPWEALLFTVALGLTGIAPWVLLCLCFKWLAGEE